MDKTKIFYSSEIDYSKKTDEELVEIIKTGDKLAANYIIDRYKNLVNIKVSKYYITGAEKDDIMQEGLIGLFKAIKCYSPEQNSSFKSFANLCIDRQLITAIKTSNRQKHMPLNSYLSLNMNAYDSDDEENNTTVMEIFNNDTIEDPLDTLTKKEYYKSVELAIDKSLSKFEKKVLNRYVQGESYVQIAEKLDAPVKSVDNAIQRIRKKAIKDLTPKEE